MLRLQDIAAALTLTLGLVATGTAFTWPLGPMPSAAGAPRLTSEAARALEPAIMALGAEPLPGGYRIEGTSFERHAPTVRLRGPSGERIEVRFEAGEPFRAQVNGGAEADPPVRAVLDAAAAALPAKAWEGSEGSR